LVLPQVLAKVSTDKKFIANLAKKAVTACAEHCVTRATANALVEAVNAKNLDLSEFAASAMQALTKAADPQFFDVQFDAGLHIIGALCSVIEGKKTRMIKYAQPALLQIKQTVGEDKLEGMILEVFNKGAPDEEAKGDPKNTKRARAILDGLEPKNSKADKSKDFRSFIKNQKTEAKDALMDESTEVKPAVNPEPVMS
jgi:hypothetical protein